MNSERAKIYTEIMKTQTAFILGLSAGVYAIVTENMVETHRILFWFLITLDLFSIGMFVALVTYFDRNT